MALIIEGNGNDWKFVKYTILKRRRTFEEGEIRNAYLSQTMSNKAFEDKDREILAGYLENNTWNLPVNQQRLDRDVERGQRSVFKYKPVDLKVKSVMQELPLKFRILRDIEGNPLAEMPALSPNPPDFEPVGRYTQARKEQFDKQHKGDFLLAEERKLLHHFMMQQSYGFAWDDTERGQFKEDFFPPIDIPTVPHKPWVLKNIHMPPGLCTEICRIIRSKLEAGVYEPSNSSYGSV